MSLLCYIYEFSLLPSPEELFSLMLLLVTPSVQGSDIAQWGGGLMGSN